MGLSLLLLTGIPSVYFLKPEWLSPVLETIGWQNPMQRTVTILVARLDGPEAETKGIASTILSDIKSKTEDYKEAKIVPLGRAITEEEVNENFIRQLLQEKKADLLIWGWYDKTRNKAKLAGKGFAKLDGLQELFAEFEDKLGALSEETLEISGTKTFTYCPLVFLAMSRYSAKDWDGAIVRLTAALESVKLLSKELELSVPYFYRGNAYYLKGDKDRALADFTKFIKINPNHAPTYVNRSAVYYDKGDKDRALADLSQALKLNPNDALAYYNRGLAYRDKGENDRAIADFTKVIELNPNDSKAYFNRGIAYHNKGDKDLAVADYTQALKIDPKDKYAYVNRGKAYIDKGENDRAIADYNQALKLNPNDAYAYVGRGFASRLKGDKQKAIADFQTSLKLAKTPEVKQAAQQQLAELGVK